MKYLGIESIRPRLARIVWWSLFIICLVYAGFALEMFLSELYKIAGWRLGSEVKLRQVPVAFLFHALLGALGLVAGVLQFNSRLRLRNILIHRTSGWIYLVAVWGASISGIINAYYFEVPALARLIFVAVGIWWFFSTSLAFWHIRHGAVLFHKIWMIRSYAISLFFITFPIWVPTLQLIAPDGIAWPVGLMIAISGNVLIAEMWNRKF